MAGERSKPAHDSASGAPARFRGGCLRRSSTKAPQVVGDVRLIDVAELARALNISPRAAYRLAERGVPHYRAGRLVRFRLEEVLEALRATPEPDVVAEAAMEARRLIGALAHR